MDKLPHDDGGPAFPFDRAMATASENGPIKTDVVAHQGISFADLIAALVMKTSECSTGNLAARANNAYLIADALIEVRRGRLARVSHYWREQAKKVQAMEEEAAKEQAAAAGKPSDG